jgi:hypothetical protein
MPKKVFLIALLSLLLNAVPFPVGASNSNPEQAIAGSSAVVTNNELNKELLPLKNSKHYNESNDPAFRRCGTNSSGPLHGYFAVSLLIFGIAGALLYFTKTP